MNLKKGDLILLDPYFKLTPLETLSWDCVWDTEQIALVLDYKFVHEYNCYYIEVLVREKLYYANLDFSETKKWIKLN